MLVRDFIEVPVPLDAAVAAVADPEMWERALAQYLTPPDHIVVARFGMQGLFGSTGAPMEVRIGRTTHLPRGTIVDVQWGHDAGLGWYPVFQADATLSALTSQMVHLEFNGCYCRSGALSSSPADRMMQHRVVEYAVRLILTRLADSVTAAGNTAAQLGVTPMATTIDPRAV